MNKKLLAAAVLLAVTVSTSSVYAASYKLAGSSKLGGETMGEFEGVEIGKDQDGKVKDGKVKEGKSAKEEKMDVTLSTKTEVKENNKGGAIIKHEGKLYFDGQIDKTWSAEVGLNIETKTDNYKKTEATKWEMENIWVKNQLTKNLSINFGNQTYHLAKGLYIDQDSTFGSKTIYNIDKNNILEFFVARTDNTQDVSELVEDNLHTYTIPAYTTTSNGVVTQHAAQTFAVPYNAAQTETRLIEVLNYAHKFHHGSIGTYVAKQGIQRDIVDVVKSGVTTSKRTGENVYNRYWGTYGEYNFSKKVNLNYEYAKNNRLDKKGYIAELKFGKLKKAKDTTFALEYMNVDPDFAENNKYTDYDSQLAVPADGFKGPGMIAMIKPTKNSQLQLQRWWGVTTNPAKRYSVPVTKVVLQVKF